MIEPPVMLWVMSLSPGFRLSIFAGVVCKGDVSHTTKRVGCFVNR